MSAPRPSHRLVATMLVSGLLVAAGPAADTRAGSQHQARATTAGTQLWLSRFSARAGEAAAVALSPDGSRVFVIGAALGLDGKRQIATVAYDTTTGQEIWVARFPPRGTAVDAVDLALSADGLTVHVAGTLREGGKTSCDRIAYDTRTGDYLGSEGLRGARGARAAAIAAGQDGSVYLACTALVEVPMMSVTSSREDARGNVISWSSGYQWVGGFDEAADLAVSPDGRVVYLGGTSAAAGRHTDYVVAAFRASDGKRRWDARYDGPSRHDEELVSIAVSPDGTRVYATGSSIRLFPPNQAVDDVATVAYRASTGKRLWTVRDQRQRGSVPTALTASPTGGFLFVAGRAGRWKRTGSTSGQMEEDYATLAYRAGSGTARWAALYNGPRDDFDTVTAVAVSPDGRRVYVTGQSVASGPVSAYATVAYRASTGRKLWIARYAGPRPGYNRAVAIAVSPDGSRAYVTGTSQDESGRLGFVTVAYRTS